MSEAEAYEELRALGIDADASGLPDENGLYSIVVPLSRTPSHEEEKLLKTAWGEVLNQRGGKITLRVDDDRITVRNTTVELVVNDHRKRLLGAISTADEVGRRAWSAAKTAADQRAQHIDHVREVSATFI